MKIQLVLSLGTTRTPPFRGRIHILKLHSLSVIVMLFWLFLYHLWRESQSPLLVIASGVRDVGKAELSWLRLSVDARASANVAGCALHLSVSCTWSLRLTTVRRAGPTDLFCGPLGFDRTVRLPCDVISMLVLRYPKALIICRHRPAAAETKRSRNGADIAQLLNVDPHTSPGPLLWAAFHVAEAVAVMPVFHSSLLPSVLPVWVDSISWNPLKACIFFTLCKRASPQRQCGWRRPRCLLPGVSGSPPPSPEGKQSLWLTQR